MRKENPYLLRQRSKNSKSEFLLVSSLQTHLHVLVNDSIIRSELIWTLYAVFWPYNFFISILPY